MKYYAVAIKNETDTCLAIERALHVLLSEDIWNILCIMGYSLFKGNVNMSL